MKKTLKDRVGGFLVPHSLRSQLLYRSLFIIAALLLLIGGLQYVLMKNFLYHNQAESLVSQIHSLPKNLFEGTYGIPSPGFRDGKDNPNFNPPNNDDGTEPPSISTDFDRRPFLFLPDTSLAYIDTDTGFVDRSNETGLSAPQLSDEKYAAIKSSIKGGSFNKGYIIAHDGNGNEQLLVFSKTGGPSGEGGLVQMGMATAPLKSIAMRQLLIFVGLSILALASGLMLYLPVLRRTLKPLDQMVQTVEDTNAGNLNNRFPSTLGQTEIDRLAVAFNGMMGRLERSFDAEREAKEQMRRFIADASHELRTPLTSIHGFLEVLLRGAANNPDQLKNALNSMLGESTRMKKLVEDLLTLAKLDRAPVVSRTETRLDTLILEMEPHLRMLAGDRNVQFDITSNIRGMYDCDKIKQVILNLFHNAVQHTDPVKGSIVVTLSAHDPNHSLISVKDNGPGIPPEHLSHVFERFYRSDVSRTRKHGGAGLGLAISQSIVEVHGGKIRVQSEVGKGTIFEVILPSI
ncbi:putative sensor histidine kinase TcrY [compost metagenome]